MFDKDKYWENRKAGRRGQGEEPKTSGKNTASQGANMGFSDDGTVVVRNRAYRRQRFSLFPKTSQLRKKKPRKSKSR